MKILHLEDDPRDAALVREILGAADAACAITVVSSRAEFVAALARGGFDLILSDYRLPDFNGLDALRLVREQAPPIPFIFVSGTLGEERAIDAVHAGAADYVVKDRLQRLPLSVQRVLRDAADQRARRHTEERLAQEQYLLRLLMENLPDHVYFKDTNSAFLAVNRSMADRLGLEPGQLQGKSDADLFPPEHARQARADEQRIIETGEPLLNVEEKEVWPDGAVSWVVSTKLPLRNAEGRVVGTFGISRDITARKLAEERIREQAEILDHAPIAIVITDLAHRITYSNAGAEEIYGLPRERLVGLMAEDLMSPETMAHLGAGRTATLADGQWTGEVPVVTKSGLRRQAEFHMSLIRDHAGQPRARLSIAIDVTENKKLEEQFLRAQRLESLGMLAAGIAHDFNNVLAPVLMGAPLLRTSARSPVDLRVLEAIEKSVERGAALVQQILSFAQGVGGGKSLVQVKHLLRDIAELVVHTFPKSILLEEAVPRNLWPVVGNATQIHQIILNLCVNARDAMPAGGTLVLRAEDRQLDGAPPGAVGPALPGPYLVLEVTDTGTGIAPSLLGRIWDPFFTTKGADKGTGLGLATVRGIAVNHGGFVTVETELGRGTTFKVYLPAAKGPDAPSVSDGSRPPGSLQGAGELVLVVDDEPNIRDLVKVLLTRHGYRVLVAGNGLEAIALFAPRATEFSLVITDVNMPEMGGIGLAHALPRFNPSIRLLFVSGAGSDSLPAELTRLAGRILRKPFSGDEMLGRVRATLDAPVRR